MREDQLREERSAMREKKRAEGDIKLIKKRLHGTGFSSIKEVDGNWSRFGFVPKPSTAIEGAAGPSGAAAGPSQLPDEVVEI